MELIATANLGFIKGVSLDLFQNDQLSHQNWSSKRDCRIQTLGCLARQARHTHMIQNASQMIR